MEAIVHVDVIKDPRVSPNCNDFHISKVDVIVVKKIIPLSVIPAFTSSVTVTNDKDYKKEAKVVLFPQIILQALPIIHEVGSKDSPEIIHEHDILPIPTLFGVSKTVVTLLVIYIAWETVEVILALMNHIKNEDKTT